MLLTPLRRRGQPRNNVTAVVQSWADEKAEFQRVLQSTHFRRTPKLQRFLSVVCDYYFQGRAAEINEFLIATEAFGKGPDFDPGQDSLVRVQAREVRRRLGEYYQSEGAGSQLILEIPLGHYVPEFTTVSNRPVFKNRSARAAAIMLGATALVCIAILFLAVRERRRLLGASALASTSQARNPELAHLWNRFRDSDVPTLLVLSNPDVGQCKPSRPADGPVTVMVDADGDPCPDDYTGMGEAVALHLITNIFRSARQTLVVKQSRMVNADDVKHYNLILLGGKSVNVWTRRLGDDLSLEQPKDLEQRYATVFDQKTMELIRDRALIAVRRHVTTGHWLLFLFGQHSQGTQAAAEASSDERFLSQLKWPANAPFPDNFRILVGVSVNDGIPQEPLPAAVLVP